MENKLNETSDLMPVILTYIKFSLVYTVICRMWEHTIPHSNSLCRQWDIKCVGHMFLTVAVLFDIQKQRVACQTLVILQHLTGKCIINTSINAQLQARMSVKNGLLKSEIYFRIVNYPHCHVLMLKCYHNAVHIHFYMF